MNDIFTDLLVTQELILNLYYATEEEIGRDQILHVQAGKYHPEFIVIHPDDFEKFKKRVKTETDRQLVHLREYRHG